MLLFYLDGDKADVKTFGKGKRETRFSLKKGGRC